MDENEKKKERKQRRKESKPHRSYLKPFTVRARERIEKEMDGEEKKWQLTNEGACDVEGEGA
jgi:hypothetical protein